MRPLKSKSASARGKPTNRHDVEGAIEQADDARDIARDLLRQLPDYDGNELEDTARHDMSPHPQQMHVHVHQHSQPDNDEPSIEVGPVHVRGLPKWLATAIVIGGVVVAAATALVAHFAGK